MLDSNNYLLMKVARQSKVTRVDVCDETSHIGYEPQCKLELKGPGRFSIDSLEGTLSGKAALHQFKEGDLVAVKLEFWGHRKKGEYVNHIIIKDIKLVKELDYLFL
jgi:hypothetical protein